MDIKNFWKEHKVFIVGLIAAVGTAAYEIITKGSDFSWWAIAWSAFIGGISFAGKNLRGQWASIFTTLGTTTYAFYMLHNSPEGLTSEQVIKDLIFPAFLAIIGVFNTSPPKMREYEHTPTIVEAKNEAAVIKEEKK